MFGSAWGRRGAARWADLAARFLFIAVLSVLWWQVSIRPGALTGAVAYPLLIVAVLLELSPQYARGKLFRAFVTLMAACFAGLMWLFPSDFPARIFGQVSEVLRPLGGLALVMAGGFVLLRRRFAAERWLYLGFAGLMGYLAFCLGRRGSWTGMELYLVVGVACLLVAGAPRVPQVFNLNTKLLRGMVVAGLLPLIAVGGLASYFAQRELESTLRADIAQATAADADHLGQELARTRTRLVELASKDALLKASLARDADFLQFTLERLREDEPLLEQIFVHDRAGNRWASSGGNAVGRNFAQREYHRRAVEREEVYVSTPFQGGAGGPIVVIAVPIKDGRVVRGVLGGVMSLRLMGMPGGRAGAAYRVRLIDRRDLRVLRDSGGGRAAGAGEPAVRGGGPGPRPAAGDAGDLRRRRSPPAGGPRAGAGQRLGGDRLAGGGQRLPPADPGQRGRRRQRDPGGHAGVAAGPGHGPALLPAHRHGHRRGPGAGRGRSQPPGGTGRRSRRGGHAGPGVQRHGRPAGTQPGAAGTDERRAAVGAGSTGRADGGPAPG